VQGGKVVKASRDDRRISKDYRGGGVRVCSRFKSSLYSFICVKTRSGLRGISLVFLKEEIAI
jgi:hypothetical protein